jgi:4'-phosphopantetheinyl transferase
LSREMRVRFAPLDIDPAELAMRSDWLTDDELERAELLERPLDRDRAIARRAILRELVAMELGIEPDEVPLTVSPVGRPELPDDVPLEISVSSSGGMAAFAFGPRLERLGVDIEAVGRPELVGIDPSLFLDEEELAMLPEAEPERGDWLLASWTLKEALAKALGVGLMLPLTDLHIGDIARPLPRLRGDWRRLGVDEVRVESFAAAPEGFTVAVAMVTGA